MGTKEFFYVGSWGTGEQPGNGKGIYICTLDVETGELGYQSVKEGVCDPGFVHVTENRRFLFSASEDTALGDGTAGSGGRVASFRIDGRTGTLTEIGNRPSCGSLPVYLCTTEDNRYLLCANHSSFAVVSRYIKNEMGEVICEKKYDEANVSVFPISEAGEILAPADIMPVNSPGSVWEYEKDPALYCHEFSGQEALPGSFMQSHAFAHCVTIDHKGFIYITDRGSDRIYLCTLNHANGRLIKRFCYRSRLGTAPRHLCVHSVLPCFYMTNEIESSVSVFRVDRNRFTFHSIQTVPTLPGQVHEKNGPGDIKLHPSGKYLYVTNRGYDSIAVYEISQVSGLLTLKQVYKVKYANLRSCAVARDGRHLIACSQYDDKVLSLSLSPETGEVEEIVSYLDLDTPTCVCLLS